MNLREKRSTQDALSRLLRRHLLPRINSYGNSGQNNASQVALAFIVILANDRQHPAYSSSEALLNKETNEPLALFFANALKRISSEIEMATTQQHGLTKRLIDAADRPHREFRQALFEIFFPEGLPLLNQSARQQAVNALRRKRTVTVEKVNPNPLETPEQELVFTSNLLLGVPLGEDTGNWFLPKGMKDVLKQVQKEKQLFWYDHPIPLGIEKDKNEAIYGLQGLQQMLREETAAAKQPLTVILSASATHAGLRPLVKTYFDFLFSHTPLLKDLQVFIFTEDNVRELLREILKPLAEKYFPSADFTALEEALGVDGEYGRHYSFLKAIVAFWQVFVNPQVKATFKIDLDQVFPQTELKKYTGKTTLEHFRSPLWGATGRDEHGRDIEFGLFAGALVNEKDIKESLFMADVRFPEAEEPESLEQLIFNSRLPQAQSTLAEMMTRYDSASLDGVGSALQRVHVTGGANGILIGALRKHRPFTPSFLGRAEDQSYLMSVLFNRQPALRYAHAAGLIMRHDKEVFARDAVQAAAAGKEIGDYIRLLTFSEYARALPWPFDEIKAELEPFTGSFISYLPQTLVYLRFALRLLDLTGQGNPERANNFARLGAERLNDWLERFPPASDRLKKQFQREQQAWKLYYDLLDKAEDEQQRNSALWKKLKQRAHKLTGRIRLRQTGNTENEN